MATPSERHAVERVHPPDAVIRVVNPVMRAILSSPLHRALSGQLMLLRYTGRRSGRRIALPIGRREHEGRTAAYTNSRWRHNFRDGHPAELLDRGSLRPVTGRLIEDVEVVTDVYARQIAELGRRQASRMLGVRFNVDRDPTRDEVRDAVARHRMGIVVFDPR